jgi:hypothetical protein
MIRPPWPKSAPGSGDGVRTRRDNGVLEFDPQGVAAFDAHVTVIFKYRPALNVLNTALFGKRNQALGKLVHHLVLPGTHGGQIKPGRY